MRRAKAEEPLCVCGHAKSKHAGPEEEPTSCLAAHHVRPGGEPAYCPCWRYWAVEAKREAA